MTANLQDEKLALVITTESNYYNAKKLGSLLLDKKIAACVSFVEINSLYCWEGEIKEEVEVQLNIKVRLELVDQLYETIKEIHSYQLPQFICLGISTSEQYLKWCLESI